MNPAAKAWAAAIGLLLAYEGYALATGRETLSRAVWDVEPQYPIVPFLGGLLCGHFFFSRAGAGV